ncbi:hypothetical protein ABZY14_23170 [Streptomyces sp. NPDC006617]|uniref:hypothetical protein n=1 Tax=Streptomyces sp. NPDC006617 TaxID=3155354 RepID=UPI0033AA783F
MPNFIGRLVACPTLLHKPRGTHRRTSPHPATRTAPSPPLLPSATGAALLPSHRSPYGLRTVLDGTETAAVRPYLLVGAPYAGEAAA